LALPSAEVAAAGPVAVDVTLEAQGDEVIATGTVTFDWHGACRRCLEPVEGSIVAEFREIFERHPVENETWELHGEQIDLEPIVREAVVLALPLAPLCSPDCAGPDPEHFPAKAGDVHSATEPEDGERPRDPRWAALDQLTFESRDR
jgi:uncharacterized protein